MTNILSPSYRTILSVALPLMGSTFIQSVVLITDSAFLSRHSTLAFDAAGNGGLVYISLFMILVGMNDGLQIMLARRIGEARERYLPSIFKTGISINVIIAIALFLISLFIVPMIIHGNAEHADLAEKEVEYVQIRSIGFFFATLSLSINAFLVARGKTSIVLISAVITAITNILLDYTFIFGKFGIPTLGLSGAAWASVLADLSGMLFLLIYIIRQKRPHTETIDSKESKNFHPLFGIGKPSLQLTVRAFTLGTPIMLQGLIALSTWTVFFFWIEQMGIHELTVSQTIRSFYFLAFVPIFGFGATTKTYVSQYLGNGKKKEINKVIRRIQLLTFLFLIIFFHGALLYPEQLISIINPEVTYLEDTVHVLRFISGSIALYGFFSIYFNVITGSGNTRYSFIIELVSVIIYLISAYLLIKVYELDIIWVWSVEYIYFGMLGILSIGYLTLFDWKKKVI